MKRLFAALALLSLLALGFVSCHLNESEDDILVLTLSDSLLAYPKVEVVILDITGTQTYAELWDNALPNPPVLRYNFGKSQDHSFLVRVKAKDAGGEVKLIKTIPWEDGKEGKGKVHVVTGAEARYDITGFKVTAAQDKDGDGFARSFQAKLDVDGNTNFDTLNAKLYYQVEGSSTWTLLAEKERFGIAGSAPGDSLIMPRDGNAHRTVNLKAEIYLAGGAKLLDSAVVMGFKEETAAQDSAGLRWVLKNNTGAVLRVSGQVGTGAFTNLKLDRNDSLVRTLDTKDADDKIIYKAIADGPGEAWESSDTVAMEMDEYEVRPVLGPLKDYFVLNLKNESSVTIDQIIINPGANEKRYDMNLPPLNEFRNMGLFPYVTGTTLGLRFNGTEKTFNILTFGTNTVGGFRFADFTLQ